MQRFSQFEQLIALPQLSKWFIIACLVGILSGIGSAALLASLEWATDWRESHVWIIALLPVAGFVSGWFYHRYGKTVESGNNLLLEEIHSAKKVIPLRMAPMVLLGTDLTHLFGGSAGREGTALQIAASLADQLTKIFRLKAGDRRILLMAGLSAGFASVFGTPLAGTIFGLEVLAIGTINHNALFPCLVAAVVGDRITLSLGLHHTAYRHATFVPEVTPVGLISAILAGVAFGIVAMIFAKLTHYLGHSFFKAKITYAPLRPAIGGAMVAVLVLAIGSTKYVGLGIPTIVDAFNVQLPPWDFAAKIGLTALTLGAGFKGGEVTPLFFIGATLGNALSTILPLPMPLLAGMGFVAVFGGAANTPIASTLMGIELFGLESGVFVAIACVMSYLFSGHAGIYGSQRIGSGKYHFMAIAEGLTLATHALAKKAVKDNLVLQQKSESKAPLFKGGGAESRPANPDCSKSESKAPLFKGGGGDLIWDDFSIEEFLARDEDIKQNQVIVLRLYFPQGDRRSPTTVWQKLHTPSPVSDFATRATAFGIKQAIVYRDTEFVPSERSNNNPAKTQPPSSLYLELLEFLELLDQEEKLRHFLTEHLDELTNVKIFSLRSEELSS